MRVPLDRVYIISTQAEIHGHCCLTIAVIVEDLPDLIVVQVVVRAKKAVSSQALLQGQAGPGVLRLIAGFMAHLTRRSEAQEDYEQVTTNDLMRPTKESGTERAAVSVYNSTIFITPLMLPGRAIGD